MRIGVFDSGIGGEAIARDIKLAFPDAKIVTVNDRRNVPYGNRTAEDIIRLTNSALQPLLKGRFDYIVIACNTATATSIDWLRTVYPSQTFIGLEPMIKPASELSMSGKIAVFATPATLASNRFTSLKKEYLVEKTCIEPDCSSWAKMIEDTQVNESQIQQTIELVLSKGVDIIVLACTHYHWIRELIKELVNDRAIVIDPSDAIVNRIKQLTADLPH